MIKTFASVQNFILKKYKKYMKEMRILLNESMFTNLCKMGFYTAVENNSKNDLYFTKEDIISLVTGKVVAKDASYEQTNWLFMLQDIGFDIINEILKRSPIYSDLAGTL
jgi:hypothetical protein